ncbi:dipeptidyl-peptidase 3 family protein [Moheibacter lacus]|uniref:Zn-dependent hydrolase n=1 Tax=Moheibacter lacus TaxID=2745851 RepID=A0A838ZIV7_9FLAO|nr:Zn-dependent hydrolase [Moheibacter lacus]MBA5629591.1 Zn-dependent hydrolase [Moheibacter lacus]
MKSIIGISFLTLCLVLINCKKEPTAPNIVDGEKQEIVQLDSLKSYATVRLETDLSHLSDKEKAMLVIMIEASQIMDELFWYEAYGDKEELLSKVAGNTRNYVEINYGPWDRLDNMQSFVKGFGPKPLGANFYPLDMTVEEFENANLPEGKSQYTFVRRNEDGGLYTVPYHVQFKDQIANAAGLLRKAATFADDEGLKIYLETRATALETDKYFESDIAWMNMKTNRLDFVVGPIETYEDQLFGYKAAHEAYVLVKDMEWSKKLEKYAKFLPELQRNLPVPDKYKTESPGTDSDLNAYDVVYYAGDCNAGGKTIAINLPNDERVQLEKGTRRLQLKNAMRAKFDKIMVPIADVLIDDSQRQHVKFDAFFANVMFHEVAHGLGIKNTINDKGTVREALKEQQSHLEEGKADILGLYMVNQLLEKGELEGQKEDFMVTFLAGIFRSVRFGESAHGSANMICFNYFKERGAFKRTKEGKYIVDFPKMEAAMNGLSELILTLQGNGDYEGVKKLTEQKGHISKELQKDLDKLKAAGIPDDIIFEQGVKVLGL